MVINTLASRAPVPGGMGVKEGGLVAAMTATGIPTDASIPGELISRMCTAYLPPIWGYPSLVLLRKHSYGWAPYRAGPIAGPGSEAEPAGATRNCWTFD